MSMRSKLVFRCSFCTPRNNQLHRKKDYESSFGHIGQFALLKPRTERAFMMMNHDDESSWKFLIVLSLEVCKRGSPNLRNTPLTQISHLHLKTSEKLSYRKPYLADLGVSLAC